MVGQMQSAVCQRCGTGFVLTSSYTDLLARRGAKVIIPLLCPTCFLTQGPLPKQRGEIKWFSPRRHYGFIVSEEGEDVFFHEEQLLGNATRGPEQGQPVQFHLHYPIKGPEALNVELVAA
jgi:CspA family cold shock protein